MNLLLHVEKIVCSVNQIQHPKTPPTHQLIILAAVRETKWPGMDTFVWCIVIKKKKIMFLKRRHIRR